MDRVQLLDKITKQYLSSRDFNGLPISIIGGDFQSTRESLRQLVQEGAVVLNFGDRHPNPYILAFEPEPSEEQVKKLDAMTPPEPQYEEGGPLTVQTNPLICCAYPSRDHLASVVDQTQYRRAPFTLLLALGEPQLSYRAFNLRVLELYRNDPRYSYETDDVHGRISEKKEGSLEHPDDVLLQTFGFAYDERIENRYVAVFLRYLSDLTPEHQQRWKLEEHTGRTLLHPGYAQQTAGEWPEKQSIFTAFCEELRIINEMTVRMCGKQVFRRTYHSFTKPERFGFLVRPTTREYEDFVQLLDKMMADNLNRLFFCARGERKECGTIALLEEWLNARVRLSDPAPKDQMLKVFRDIRAERSPPAHHVRDDEWDDTYFSRQRETILKAYDAVRTLRLILANHPLARTVEVPDWLFKGEIWTF
jgi:hypothetical protein